jgi:predicted metal-dependent HD superfamily phosphohydrolase
MATYGQPRRFNAVTLTMMLIGLAAAYWVWRFFPAYFDGWTVDHILKESASRCYKISNLGEPERTKQLKALVDSTRADIIKQGNVQDPDLLVNLDIEGNSVVVSAEYNVPVLHPWINKTTLLRFRKSETADIKKVQWE